MINLILSCTKNDEQEEQEHFGRRRRRRTLLVTGCNHLLGERQVLARPTNTNTNAQPLIVR